MKIYRTSERRSGYEHDKYVYHSSKRAAILAQEAANRDMEAGEDDEENMAFTPDKVEEIEFTATKKGILEMLNRECSYPDNG